MSGLNFAKAVATGNDFVIVDNRFGAVGSLRKLAIDICDRKRSVGADGLLVLERSKKADFRMRIVNPDGSEAEMCGNGSRCIALYAKAKRIAPRRMTIETLAGVLGAEVDGDLVKVKLTGPRDIKTGLSVSFGGRSFKIGHVNTGVPHAINFASDIDKLDVNSIGRLIRYHKRFAPRGTNVDFVSMLGKNRIKIRTYERGVEGETLACGTGSVAAAIMGAVSKGMSSPVTVETRGGERLKVYFEKVGQSFKNVCLEGKARLVFNGVIKKK